MRVTVLYIYYFGSATDRTLALRNVFMLMAIEPYIEIYVQNVQLIWALGESNHSGPLFILPSTISIITVSIHYRFGHLWTIHNYEVTLPIYMTSWLDAVSTARKKKL